MNKKIFFAVAVIFILWGAVAGRADEQQQNVLQQPDASSIQSEPWGSYGAAIGIASGTITEFGTTTAGIDGFSAAYLGWECDMRVEDNALPYWCAHYIPLAVATTTNIGSGVTATVFQNPHQAIDGDAELYYVYYGGSPRTLGVGTAANTTPGLSWAWTCGYYCRNGGSLGGTSNYFVPYLEMGPQADPPQIGLLSQSDGHGDSIVNGGTANGSITLTADISSPAGDPLVLQVEVRDASAAFSGEPTATSSVFGMSGGQAAVTASDLAPGSYHWAARAVDTVTSESSPWVFFGSAGATDFVMQTPRDAVIVIPGILGSRISRVAGGDEVWPDIDLSLASDGSEISGKEMTASSILDTESVLGVSQDFYGNLFSKLEADGYASGTTLFAYPYDWRRDAGSVVEGLAQLVAEARAKSPTGKVSFVAHSFGGFVLKQYLAGLADSSFVDRVVLAGVPQLGAPMAFKVLQYGDNLGFEVPIVGSDILNSNEVKKISQNMPSLYELLPSEKYSTILGGYVEDLRKGGATVLDHDATTQMMVDGGRNANLLRVADDLHSVQDGSPVRAPLVYNIIGCSLPTISEFHIYDDGVVDVKRDIGDGTVPEMSAMNLADGFKNYFVLASTGITHAKLVSDDRPVAAIVTMLDGTAETAPLPDGISRSLADCVGATDSGGGTKGTVEFSAHGSAGLDVYDATGDHVGPNASGTIDLGIPESTYDAIGDNYFITVPASSPYRVTSESTSTDDLILREREYDGGTPEGITNYVVPSVTASSSSAVGTTTAELDMTGSGVSILSVTENNGNEATSTVVAPSSVFTATDATDITPPVITMSDISSPVFLNSTATLTFAAMDAESGVAVLRATFDGAPISNGAMVTFGTIGVHSFQVKAIDTAGNSAEKEMKIAVVGSPREISFAPSADTFVADNAPGEDNGSGQFLRLRARGRERVLIKFDPVAIKDAIGSSTITSAKLVFSVAKNWGNWEGIGTIEIYPASSAWSEYAVPWSAAVPAVGVAPIATSTVSNNTMGTISFDVTSDVVRWLAGAENDGWIIKKADECAPGVIDLGSRESDAPPELEIKY
jgi:hypothetical protein